MMTAGQVTGAKSLADGKPVDFQGMGTMSKSKRNGVDPQALIEQYGADTARFFMMFAAPPEQTLEWSDSGVEGAHRFLRRMWNFGFRLYETMAQDGGILETPDVRDVQLNDIQEKARREIHLVLRQANHDISKHQFNTVVSATMKILNVLDDVQLSLESPRYPVMGANSPQEPMQAGRLARNAIYKEGFSILLRLLSPICPHIAHALWRELGYGDDILAAKWPEPLEAALVQDEIELVIQVNGKLRGNMVVAKDVDRAIIEKLALKQSCVQKYLEGVSVRKVIVVPGKLVNVVVG